MTWQPIETAPIDADLLLLYEPGYGVRSGFWYEDDSGREFWVCVETRTITDGKASPTHWMPLPEPPNGR